MVPPVVFGCQSESINDTDEWLFILKMLCGNLQSVLFESFLIRQSVTQSVRFHYADSMTITDMNAPCICGSGKKYKKCCRYHPDEKARRKALATEQKKEELARKEQHHALLNHAFEMRQGTEFENADPDEMLDEIYELLDQNQREDAEKIAKGLYTAFPELSDGAFELGQIAMARHHYSEAADFFKQAEERAIRNGNYHPQTIEEYRELAQSADQLAKQK